MTLPVKMRMAVLDVIANRVSTAMERNAVRPFAKLMPTINVSIEHHERPMDLGISQQVGMQRAIQVGLATFTAN